MSDETRGGKPKPGGKKDGRLSGNYSKSKPGPKSGKKKKS